jgi:hypothetical protein
MIFVLSPFSVCFSIDQPIGFMINWINQLIDDSHIHPHFFTQVLTTLHLYNNQIGDNGAQKLGDALKANNVSYFFS